jgi:GMP synthase - Glutamine amidotransferase domain
MSQTKVGILETGSPPPPLQQRFGSYSAMIRELLGPDLEFTTFDVRSGELPQAAESCHAYVITGSASGVYDGDPWIDAAKDFVRAASGRAAMVGICFGHQLLAEAFGGKVIKSPRGWGIGLHRYDVQNRATWMDDTRSIAVPASHQDQIVQLPADAYVLGGSEFTPYGIVEYPQRRALSLQSHPEFTPDYAAALIELRRTSKYTPEQADRALDSLRQPNDRERVGRWLAQFLRTSTRG